MAKGRLHPPGLEPCERSMDLVKGLAFFSNCLPTTPYNLYTRLFVDHLACKGGPMMIGHVKNEANPGRPGATLKEGPFSARPVPKCF